MAVTIILGPRAAPIARPKSPTGLVASRWSSAVTVTLRLELVSPSHNTLALARSTNRRRLTALGWPVERRFIFALLFHLLPFVPRLSSCACSPLLLCSCALLPFCMSPRVPIQSRAATRFQPPELSLCQACQLAPLSRPNFRLRWPRNQNYRGSTGEPWGLTGQHSLTSTHPDAGLGSGILPSAGTSVHCIGRGSRLAINPAHAAFPVFPLLL